MPDQKNPSPDGGGERRDAQTTPDKTADRYHGFSLNSVMWGYRDIFEKSIDELFQQGCLGPQRQEVTSRFFDLLKQADQSCFDHVLKEFLGALNPRNRWIMDLPGVFADLVELGAELAKSRLYCGMRFFETLAAGGMGETPRQVRECLNWIRRLRETDDDLAMAFLVSYRRLSQRLRGMEMERYVEVASQIHHSSPENGCAFLRGELATSETYILSITQECRLCDVDEALRALIKALAGGDYEVADLGQLDSDDLLERGAATVTVAGHVYLPERFRHFDTAPANHNWYMLCGVISAAMMLDDSFACIHGHPRYRTCADLAGDDIRRVNLFQIIEFVRVLRRTCRRWPGAQRLIAWGLQAAMAGRTPEPGPERLLADAMNDSVDSQAVQQLRQAADDCINCFDSAQRLDDPWSQAVLAEYPQVATVPLRPVGFMSDFMFPMGFSNAPSDQLVADLKDAAQNRQNKDRQDAKAADDLTSGDDKDTAEEEMPSKIKEAVFAYDEWDFRQNEYRPAWCRVHQKPVEPATFVQSRQDWLAEARKVRAVFERLKPDVARREKYLAHGDDINVDLLLEHQVDRLREPSPPVRFYEKPVINHRDLAVLILLDVSGSTGEELDGQNKVLDIEKQAAVILGQGLATLGDRFAVCGFSSNGREKCEYMVFKSFDDDWSSETISRVMSAWPRSCTRIGPALRHSGRLLSLQPVRQRLVILVTDGKPMDEGYDPTTRYAQHDVRMACEENAKEDIHTFAISTEENSVADMEIMFPRRRFVILPGIRQLPGILPQLYLRLTF